MKRRTEPALTTAERLNLANQYAILAVLFPKHRAEYEAKRLLVEEGAPVWRGDVLAQDYAPSTTSAPAADCRRSELTDTSDRGGALTPW